MSTAYDDALTDEGTVPVMNLSMVCGPKMGRTKFLIPRDNGAAGSVEINVPYSTDKKPAVYMAARKAAWLWRLNGQNKSSDRGIRLSYDNPQGDRVAEQAALMKLVAQQTRILDKKEAAPIPSARDLYPNYGPIAADAIPDGVVTTETIKFAEKQKARLAAQGKAIVDAQKPIPAA